MMKPIKEKTMSDYIMKVTWEQVDHIMVSELRKTMECMNNYLNNYDSSNVLRHIFSHNDEEDKALIKAHRDAAEILLTYYGNSNE